jgi:hypothetical protein
MPTTGGRPDPSALGAAGRAKASVLDVRRWRRTRQRGECPHQASALSGPRRSPHPHSCFPQPSNGSRPGPTSRSERPPRTAIQGNSRAPPPMCLPARAVRTASGPACGSTSGGGGLRSRSGRAAPAPATPWCRPRTARVHCSTATTTGPQHGSADHPAEATSQRAVVRTRAQERLPTVRSRTKSERHHDADDPQRDDCPPRVGGRS